MTKLRYAVLLLVGMSLVLAYIALQLAAMLVRRAPPDTVVIAVNEYFGRKTTANLLNIGLVGIPVRCCLNMQHWVHECSYPEAHLKEFP